MTNFHSSEFFIWKGVANMLGVQPMRGISNMFKCYSEGKWGIHKTGRAEFAFLCCYYFSIIPLNMVCDLLHHGRKQHMLLG